MSHSTLGTYVNDHLALMTGEIELLRRCGRQNDGSMLATFLSGIVSEVESQANQLRQLLESYDEDESSIKQATAWFAEKLGRLKPNDGGSGYTNLARVVELEALICFAESRRMLWQSLAQTPAAARLSAAVESSEQQATSQLKSLRKHHGQAVSMAFPGPNHEAS